MRPSVERLRKLVGGDALRSAMLDSGLDGIICIDQYSRIVEFNRAAEQMFGRSRDEVVGENLEALIPPAFRARHREGVARYLATGDGPVLGRRLELAGLRADGHEFPAELAIVRIANSEPPMFVGYIRDITDRKQVEEELRRREARLRTIFETEPECLKCMTQDCVLLEINPAGLAMIEADSADEVLGKNVLHLVDPPCRAAFQALVDRVFAGEEGTLEFTITGLKGGHRSMEIHAAPLRGEHDEVLCMLGVSRDLTVSKAAVSRLKTLENQFHQAQRVDAIGQFAGGIAHDFNNLLMVIVGYCELLSPNEPVDPSMVKGILDAASKAASLTKQLLAFGRRQVLHLRPVDLNRVVGNLEGMLRRLIPENIQIAIHLARDLGSIHADPVQIEQIIINLSVNARDAMPAGGTLTIGTANIELNDPDIQDRFKVKPGRYAMLTLSDTGDGMDEETQSHIFEPFFTTKQIGQGAGLGLAVVYGIVKQIGGYIWVRSEVGRGSTFELHFPILDVSVEQEAPVVPVKAATTRDEVILVVEDEPTVLRITSTMLRSAGYTILEASTPSAALAHCVRPDRPPALLLSDIVMPEMNGVELARQVRALYPAIEVLFMSGYAPTIVDAEGGLDEATLLQKPFSKAALLDAVHKKLHRHALPARD